jgi:signal transduction histidine kinase
MDAMLPSAGGGQHRASGHTCVVLPAEPATALPADAPPAPDLYGDAVASSAVRSFLAEPPAPDPPVRVWRDWVLIAVLVVAGVLEAIFREDLPLPAVALVLGVTPALALLWRRTHPLTVTVIVCAALALADVVTRLGTGEALELYTAAYALLLPYALFRWGAGRDAAIGMAIILVWHVITSALVWSLADLAIGALILSLPAAVGASVRYRASSRQRETDQVRLREREQLARELHDTVAHHVSAVAIQAQAGRTVAASRPDAAVRAFEAIEDAASRTLAELRALVGALREGEEPDLAPQRGVTDIERLARGSGDGPRVDVQLAGDLGTLRPLVGAALYRIAQESITNAVKHARHATRIDVRITGDDDCVRLTVRDDGDAAPSGADPSSGYGVAGMTERAALLGGTLEAGPNADGGWTVTAVLPRNGAAR